MEIDKIGSIDELLRRMNLTPEEMEKHKELIDESRKREKTIKENCRDAMEKLSMLPGAFLAISENLIKIREGGNSIMEFGKETLEKMQVTSSVLSSSLERTQEINRTLGNMRLAMAPEDEFFKE